MIALHIKQKIKRVFKYLGFFLLIFIVSAIVDGTIHIWIKEPWFEMGDSWKMIYGAMSYRLITTWDYK